MTGCVLTTVGRFAQDCWHSDAVELYNIGAAHAQNRPGRVDGAIGRPCSHAERRQRRLAKIPGSMAAEIVAANKLYNQSCDLDVVSMRSLLLSVVLTAAAPAATPVRPAALTIVLDFRGPHSDPSIDLMKSEFESVLREAPLSFSWRSPAEVKNEPVGNLVVFRFKGKCVLEPVGYLLDERGPLAFTYSTDGAMQPFSEVACDQVTAAIRPAMSGADFAKADLLLGRALGRVLAHELLHMLSKSGAHAPRGVGKASLTGAQLIAPVLHFEAADLERIYTLP